MTSSGIVRWGSIAAMIGGALWVVWGLLSRAITYAAGGPTYGGLLRLSAGLLLVAALLTLGGLVGLDAMQGGSSWSLGRVGFYTAAVGLLAQALAAVFLLVGSEALLWLLAPGGSLAVVAGLAFYGAATLQARVLAPWCGWALIEVPPITSLLNSKVFYGSIALFGVLWVALGYVLWSRRGAPSGQRPSRVRQANILELCKAEVQLGMSYLARKWTKARPQSPANPSTSSLAGGAAPPVRLVCRASSSCKTF